jgi:phosphate transport system substrate-binding protein
MALGCGQGTPPQASQDVPAANASEPVPQAVSIAGAGATFPYPIYAQWAHEYEKITGTKLNYQSIGSGGGIAQIKAKTVNFGASDAPLEAAELETEGLIQFPLVMGGVVPVINLEGIAAGQMKLNGAVLADIFLGAVKKWNDKRIKELNPELTLPDKDIVVVHRADGSGTTWIFTNYLDKVSPAWHDKVGAGKAVEWPTGMGGKGNEGVAAYVQRVAGSIGYVEFAYALQNQMSHTLLQNQAGKFVGPTIESFQAAAASADWKNAAGFYMVLTEQPGDGSWPITGASFILLHKLQPDSVKAKAMLQFFDWCFKSGANKAVDLHYVPMPQAVIDLVRSQWATQLKGPDGAAIPL